MIDGRFILRRAMKARTKTKTKTKSSRKTTCKGPRKATRKTTRNETISSAAFAEASWYRNFVRHVELREFSPRTREAYLAWPRRLQSAIGRRDITKLREPEVADFLISLRNEHGLKDATVNQAVCAMRAFFRDHLGRQWEGWSKIKIRRDEQLPNVLSRDEVARFLGAVRVVRFRAMFTLNGGNTTPMCMWWCQAWRSMQRVTGCIFPRSPTSCSTVHHWPTASATGLRSRSRPRTPSCIPVWCSSTPKCSAANGWQTWCTSAAVGPRCDTWPDTCSARRSARSASLDMIALVASASSVLKAVPIDPMSLPCRSTRS